MAPPNPASSLGLAVELTAYCNQRCDYCYNAWRGDPPEVGSDHGRTVARVSKILDMWQFASVTITGGEPLASRELTGLMELLSARGVPFQMISNGTLATRERASLLATFSPRFVQVTLNGADAHLHEQHVGRGHFDATVSGINHLLAAGVPVAGSIVVTKKNAKHVGEILDLFASLGVQHIALSRFSPAGYSASHAAQLLTTRTELAEALAQGQAAALRQNLQVSCTLPVPPCAMDLDALQPLMFSNCPIGTSAQEYALGPDGRLRHCTLHGSGVVDTDVLDPDFDPSAVQVAAENYRKQTPDFCRGCAHEHTCGGGCGASADWLLGDARRFPDPFVWQHVDDDFGSLLAQHRRDGKTHLETIIG